MAGLFVDHLVKHLNGWGWIAVALFLATVVVALCIIVPRGKWAFGEKLKAGIVWYHENANHGEAPAIYLVGATDNLRQDRDENQHKLDRLTWFFTAECALLGLELLFWVLSAANN